MLQRFTRAPSREQGKSWFAARTAKNFEAEEPGVTIHQPRPRFESSRDVIGLGGANLESRYRNDHKTPVY